MKFAICNEVYENWPLEKAFAHASALGYTGVEIAPFTLADHVSEISIERCKEISGLAEKHELEVVGLHWLLAKTEGLHLTCDDPEVRHQTASYLRQLTTLCGNLGGAVMVFGSPQQRNLPNEVSSETGMERAADVIRKVVPELEKQNVVLALEPLGPEEGNFLLTADSAVELANLIDSPFVKLHLDVKAMSTESKAIPQIILEQKENLFHFHANDPNRRGPGMGEVDFIPIFESLRDVSYEGWISVEVFDYSPGVDKLTGDSIRYMRQIAEQVGWPS